MQTSSHDLQQRTVADKIVKAYGNRDRFLTKFNPDLQKTVCQKSDVCFFGGYPTMGQLKTAYGENTATMWLLPQLYNLSEYCGCRDKLQGKPLEMCANVIATEFYYLSVTELMLFFHRFKSGRYGRFYGSVDPLVITTSLRDFIKERAIAYDKHEQKIRKQQEYEDKKKSMSRKEWEELKWLFNMGYEPWRIKKELTENEKTDTNNAEF